MGMTKEQRLNDKHAFALADFDAIQCAVREERMQCLEDRRFYSIVGAQWEGGLGDQFENKPKFELNKVHLAVIRIFNEYRNNRITVDFVSKDGTQDDKLADTCDSLYRADEQDSGAEEAYDNCFEEGTGGGFGAFRLRTCYEDEYDDEDTRQRVRFEPIFDADSCVFFNLDAKRQDKNDAKRCYVLTGMPIADYKEEYDDDPATWPKEIKQSEFDWSTPDTVYIAEFYEVEEKEELVHVFRGLALADNAEPDEMMVLDTELKEDPEKLNVLMATGFREVRQKRVKRRRIHKYIMSGSKILSDEGYIAGTEIPIVPFYGKRWIVDGIERCMGHVRLAKDAQRLYNMLMSWLAEMAARFDMEKPILTPEQIAGHAMMWANDNVEKFPYLLINPITDASGQQAASGPVGYTRAPNIPPAMAALMQIAEQALQDLLGNQQAGEQILPNISGKAVELIQNRLDMQVYIYMSNMAKAVKRAGEIWLSMMKDIAVEEGRKMKTVANDGSTGSVEIMKPAYDTETATEYTENDFSKAKLDVTVDVGPSSSSKRGATVRALTALKSTTQDPETIAILDSLIMMNMEGEGLSDARQFFRRKLVRMGVIKPTDEEAQELQQEAASQQPDPNAEYLKAAAAEAQANSVKAQADTALQLAKAEQTKAETAKTLAEVGTEHQNQAIRAAEAIRQAVSPPTHTS